MAKEESYSAVEHGSFLLFFITSMDSSKSKSEMMEEYFKANFSHIFLYVPYSVTVGFVMQVSLVQFKC